MDNKKVFNRQLDPVLMGKKIYRLRTESNLTRDALADLTGISASSIRCYEMGTFRPVYNHLFPIAEALGVAPECLCVYSISTRGEVNSAVNSLCSDYNLMHLSAERTGQRKGVLVPTGLFMFKLFEEWEHVISDVRSGSKEIRDLLAWQDMYQQYFDAADFPRRFAFEHDNIHGGLARSFSAWRFSKQLVAIRSECHLQQKEMAEQLGVTLSQYRGFEQGKRLPDDETRFLIARNLNVAPSSLIFYDFVNPLQAAHALFQISNMMHWVPRQVTINGRVVTCLG